MKCPSCGDERVSFLQRWECDMCGSAWEACDDAVKSAFSRCRAALTSNGMLHRQLDWLASALAACGENPPSGEAWADLRARLWNLDLQLRCARRHGKGARTAMLKCEGTPCK